MKGGAVIIGCGAAGLSAALFLARHGGHVTLVADMPPERAQSSLAVGGINAALGDGDSAENHARDTLSAGHFLAGETAVRGMTEAAPSIIRELEASGAVFRKDNDRAYSLRRMGGQSCGRAVHAAGGIGRQVMDALANELRRHEAKGEIECRFGWSFRRLALVGDRVCGAWIRHSASSETAFLPGPVVMACGGLNGVFGFTTGSVANTGEAAASLFADGVPFSNLEFIQFHPTTIRLRGKSLLVSEAARSEGGRLFVLRDGRPFHFLEEKYGPNGSLMPRDVISREEWRWLSAGHQVYLDLRHLNEDSRRRLSGSYDDCIRLAGLDPAGQPIPVEPGIHYFMGGIQVDCRHRSPMEGLYAAGECACQYHGANRLGGNSLLGALYGGIVAAREILGRTMETPSEPSRPAHSDQPQAKEAERQAIMRKALGVVRDEAGLRAGVLALDRLPRHDEMTLLCRAMLLSALARGESRGSHFRSDCPESRKEFRKNIVTSMKDGEVGMTMEEAR